MVARSIVHFIIASYAEVNAVLRVLSMNHQFSLNVGAVRQFIRDRAAHFAGRGALLVVAALTLAACGRGGQNAEWTPVPTWTPTVVGANPQPAPGDGQAVAQVQQLPTVDPAQAQAQALAMPPTDTPTPVPPTATNTPPPTNTPLPTDTPTPEPTATPTDTPTPTPTPTPSFSFDLETAEKFPTDSLAPNVVRVYLYAYSPAELGLPGYSLRVQHNGNVLPVSERSTAGVPDQTRQEPSAHTRFTNMSVIFVEPQAGEWVLELLDGEGVAVGPPVTFNLTADEDTRELYLRYKRK